MTTNTMIAKVAAAVAGFGMVAVSFAPVAQADTTSTQAQIQALLAQVAALQAQLGGSTGASASVTFSTDLKVGSKGADVTALQNWLISKGYSIPAGATGTFGAQTKAAVAAWQAAAGITPASGFFGPISRAKVNAMGGSTTGGTTTGGTSTGTTGLTGGEATLSNFDLVSESGDLRQGVTNSQLVSAKFDVKDGDVNIQRADFEFQATNNSGSYDTHPWKYMKTATLWDGSKKLASMDVSTQDAWDDNSADSTHGASTAKYYKISFTGLNDVVKAGTTGQRLTLAVDTQSSIDSVNQAQTFKVDVPTQGIRAVDAAGINQYAGNVSDTVTVGVTASQNGKLTVSEASSDPLAGVLVGDANNTTTNLPVFAFTARNTQNVDSRITDLTFNVATTTGGTANNITTIVRKATLTIGGQNYDGTINSNNTIVFNDITAVVPGNGSITGTVSIDLYAQTNHYSATGEGLSFSLVGSTGVTAENASTGDSVGSSNITGTAQGNTQTIAVTGGINVTGNTSSNAATLTYNSNTPASSFGTFTLSFGVTAIGEDIFVPKTIGNENASTTYAGAVVATNMTGASTTSSTVTTSMTTTAKSDNTWFYVVRAGTTETFTATVTIDPTATADYQVGLDKVKFSTTDASLNSLQTLDVDQTNAQFHTTILHVPNA